MPHYYNTSNRPIVYNEAGQFFGAGEWLISDETELILRAISYGEVVRLPDVEQEQETREQPRRQSRRARKTSE